METTSVARPGGARPPGLDLGQIAAAHVSHNPMPNFWPYYDVTQYATTPMGAPIRYTYAGQVINLRNFEGLVPQKQFFVIAHDSGNSGGRSGSETRWVLSGYAGLLVMKCKVAEG